MEPFLHPHRTFPSLIPPEYIFTPQPGLSWIKGLSTLPLRSNFLKLLRDALGKKKLGNVERVI